MCPAVFSKAKKRNMHKDEITCKFVREFIDDKRETGAPMHAQNTIGHTLFGIPVLDLPPPPTMMNVLGEMTARELAG